MIVQVRHYARDGEVFSQDAFDQVVGQSFPAKDETQQWSYSGTLKEAKVSVGGLHVDLTIDIEGLELSFFDPIQYKLP